MAKSDDTREDLSTAVLIEEQSCPKCGSMHTEEIMLLYTDEGVKVSGTHCKDCNALW